MLRMPLQLRKTVARYSTRVISANVLREKLNNCELDVIEWAKRTLHYYVLAAEAAQ